MFVLQLDFSISFLSSSTHFSFILSLSLSGLLKREDRERERERVLFYSLKFNTSISTKEKLNDDDGCYESQVAGSREKDPSMERERKKYGEREREREIWREREREREVEKYGERKCEGESIDRRDTPSPVTWHTTLNKYSIQIFHTVSYHTIHMYVCIDAYSV